MRRRRTVAVGVLLAFAAGALIAESSDRDRNWPHWRGPDNNGVAPHGDPPVTWSEKENVRWKVEIPGEGSSSPIVWGDRVFVTTAIDTGESVDVAEKAAEETGGFRHPGGRSTDTHWRFVVMALSRATGEVLWETDVLSERPHEGTHSTGTYASNSAVTDGERLYAYFGSRGLFALDFDGEVVWERDFGDMRKRMTFGEGSSPALHGDTLVLIWDHEGDSFLIAVDKKTGEERWRTAREEITSWSTPLVVEHDGLAQVITSATRKVRGYDLETGEQIWEDKGVTLNAIPAPVYEDGIVYVMSGFRGNVMRAIRLDRAEGEIDDRAIVWQYDQDTPYVPSALLYEGNLYFTKSNNGVLSVFNASNGDPRYVRQRVDGLTNIYSSPVGAAGRVYITDRKGGTTVIRAGESYEVLATNELDDDFDASAAIVDNEIYLRGRHLYCIAADG